MELISLLAASAPCVPPPSLPPSESIHVSAWLNQKSLQASLGSEQDLNCDVAAFQRAELPVLIAVEAYADEARSGELRSLGKGVFAFLQSSPLTVTSLIDAGVVGGLEVDWFDPRLDDPPVTGHMGVVTELYGEDLVGDTVLRAVVYALDAAQFDARIDELEALLGHPVEAIGYESRWTVVSAAGDVRIAGSGNWMRPYTHGTATIALDGKVIVGGRDNRIEGELHAPRSYLLASGWKNTLVGLHAAKSVLVLGIDCGYSDGTHPRPGS
ncbi:MAG: hypothetical protein GY711_01305 [bacterium]|nr:hypothetical protein [bacterium]